MARRLNPTPPTGGTPSSDPKACLTVLHVEDSADNRLLLQTAFGQADMRLNWHIAETSAEAIAYLDALLVQDALEPVRWPDLVLLDLVLPCDDGFAVLRHIRATLQMLTLPVVVLTGQHQPHLVEECYRLGANSVLHKPNTFQELVILVHGIYTFWTLARRAQPSGLASEL